MLTISKPLSPAQIRTYHAEDFSNARDNYYTAADQIRGRWHGQLARRWGLAGAVQDGHMDRLAEGQHPLTGDVLVRHLATRSYIDRHGKRVKTLAHRAGWDATFSAPKSVSLTALVGGDTRVTAAHQASVGAALDALERYVQARIGGHQPAETTGQWVAAAFEHDSARPVQGYAAPQLHTHVVIFNVTERVNGESRALQPRELYKSQQYATAVYRSELAVRLTALGYALDRGSSGQPEIRGYTQDYLEASSPRRQQITAHLAQVPYTSAEAAHIAAHQTREAKIERSHADMQHHHQQLAAAFGNQPAQVVQAAKTRGVAITRPDPDRAAHMAVTFAKERNFEREAVVDERALLRDALRRSMGEATFSMVTTAFAARLATGEFQVIDEGRRAVARQFTTREMIALEQATIAYMRAGQRTKAPLAQGLTAADGQNHQTPLTAHQRAAVEDVLRSRDQIVALEGVAGSGKTTALMAVHRAAADAGYHVEGLAPTSRAAQQLADAKIPSHTLQHHLMRHETHRDGAPRLYIVDESSLASTRHVHQFLHGLASYDRVLLVGDIRQHHAIEAGRPYRQLQRAGMETVRLDHILRQRDPALKRVVENLARGDVRGAIQQLNDQDRVHEIRDREERLTALARAYISDPNRTLVIAPDHQSRRDLNQIVHQWRQQGGQVHGPEHCLPVLVTRQEMTGVDRQWAQQYEVGNVIRYTTGSGRLALPARAYARVDDVDRRDNRLTVTRPSGEVVTYDPRRLQGVTLYRQEDRAFAVGDRVQFTAPYRERRIANGELGAITTIDDRGHLRVRMDSGRHIAFTLSDHPHLDHGYAVTSHTSQGQTADRVLIHVDTEHVGEQLVNRRLAYVAVSRGRYDAQIYTNDRDRLGEALSRDVSHRSAIEPSASSSRRLGVRSAAMRAEGVEIRMARGG
jgi:conjugative relaxase-like TrwC/TraI family protein